MGHFDFTVHFTRDDLEKRLGKYAKGGSFRPLLADSASGPGASPEAYRYSGQIAVGKDVYRALICRCNGDSGYSGTFRRIQAAANSAEIPRLAGFLPTKTPAAGAWPREGFHASTDRKKLYGHHGGGRAAFLSSIGQVVELIEGAIVGRGLLASRGRGPAARALDGLIVVTGRTGTAKSKIAEGLVDSYLHRLVRSKPERRPHLVTLQDPIESRFARSLGNASAAGVDYTPRELHRDCPSVTEAVEDALRQTPAVLYIGEIRSPADWRPVFRFSASGHLCVTTAHAGSLVEGMRILMEALGARTADKRSAMAGKLRALVHLKVATSPDGKCQYCLPALWSRCDRSVAAFVSDGLASVLPHRSPPAAKGWRGCLGRRYFADGLLKAREADLARGPLSTIEREVRPQATAWDLLGE